MLPPLNDHDPSDLDADQTYDIAMTHSTFDPASDSDDALFSDSGSSYHTMSTLESREVAEYFRLVHGFTFSSDTNVPQVWPADASADRLDVLLHAIVRLCRGGSIVSESVDGMLRAGGVNGGIGARVLDMVTNSAAWAYEVAETYANTWVTSLDTKPLVPHQPHPRVNCQVYNFYDGLMEPDASFDLVHLRQGVYATKDLNLLLRELHRVLKPNGILMVTEIPIEAYEGTNPRVLLHSAQYLAKGIDLVQQACRAEGADITAWQDMSARLDPGHPHWENNQPSSKSPFNEPEAARGFHSIDLNSVPIPVGTWSSDENQKIIGSLVRLWAFHHARAVLPILLSSGAGESQAKQFMDGMLQEVAGVERFRTFMMCRMWSARKI